MTDEDTKTNLRRLEHQVEINRKESADKHAAVRSEVEGIRHDVRDMRRENKEHLAKQDETLTAHGDKIDTLLQIEADKKTRRDEREQLAKKVGIVFKVIAAIVGAITAAIAFGKLVFEVMRHKP